MTAKEPLPVPEVEELWGGGGDWGKRKGHVGSWCKEEVDWQYGWAICEVIPH